MSSHKRLWHERKKCGDEDYREHEQSQETLTRKKKSDDEDYREHEKSQDTLARKKKNVTMKITGNMSSHKTLP